MIDWTACEVVERVPGKVSGAWIVRGTRISADQILENAEAGLSPAEIVEQFEGLSIDQVERVIAFAYAHSA